MIKAAIIGLGKMGLSHAAILGGLPNVELVAMCDTDSLMQSAFKKLTKIACYTDYKKMIEEVKPDCVYVVTPTKLHYEMVIYALENGCHVFCEKPFALTVEEAEKMIKLAKEKNLVNQVGYHNRYIGTFNELKRLLEKGVIGNPYHFMGEAYGPVVLNAKANTWRSNKNNGGGCLPDYAAHVLNLINYVTGSVLVKCSGTQLKSVYSKEVEDAVYGSLELENGVKGQISVNWSDRTHRKMTTSVKVIGDKGRLEADATTLKIYMDEALPEEGLEKGWNVKYITDVTPMVDFNLRGEEYTAENAAFINGIITGKVDERNSFESAMHTDYIINAMRKDADHNI